MEDIKEKYVRQKTQYGGENNPFFGKHHSEDTKEKMKISGKKKVFTEKHCLNISKSLSGKKRNCDNYGSKNPNWKGGKSYLPYPEKFNKILKEKIRIRDNYICQYPGCLCNQLENIILYQHPLNIHHIDYDKNNCDENNLITLCTVHNSVANGNREYHENILKKIKSVGFDCDGVVCFPTTYKWDFSKSKEIADIVNNAEPNYHIIDYIKELQSKKIRVFLVTGRFSDKRNLTEEYFRKLNISFDKICMCDTNTLDDYYSSKIEHINREHIDIYYDDMLSTVNAINSMTKAVAILYKPGCVLIK